MAACAFVLAHPEATQAGSAAAPTMRMAPLTTTVSTSQVAYVTDSSNGGFDPWTQALGLGADPADGGTYTTASPASPLTVTIHDVAVSSLDAGGTAPLAGIDTLIMFAACDIGAHPTAVQAINSFFDAGGKVIVLDGAQCTDGHGGSADYSGFEKPFVSDYAMPVPMDGSSSYWWYEKSTLTASLPDCSPWPGCTEPGNAVGDSSSLSAASDGWCEALDGTDTNAERGPVMAYALNNGGTGMELYEGEAFAYATTPTAHLRLLFDDMLTQAWNAADNLACSKHAKAITLSPQADTTFTGLNETLTAKVTNGQGAPVPGVGVTFTVRSGPNAGLTGTGTTDANGLATFSYTSAITGTDVIRASFTDTENHQSQKSLITWRQSPPPPVPELKPALAVPVAGLVTAGFVVSARRRRRVRR